MSSLKLNADSGGGSVALSGPSSTTSNAAIALKLPVADGSANQILKTDRMSKALMQAREKGAWSAAVNAEVARGKAGGLYIEQKIIRTGKLEDLSAEELENRMKEILDEYSPILEGVEVTDLTNEVKERQQKMRLQPNKDKPVTLDETSDYLSESSSSSSSDEESSS